MMNLLKILIVDDDATVRIGLKTLIAWEQYGYRLVGEAANGQQAIEIVHREQPHIIITDMKMPVMDGLTLIKTLKNEEGFSVAFLVLSSYDDFELVKGAMKLGAVDYFLKLELDVHMLLSCLDEVRKTITSADSSCENETVGGVSALQSKVIRNIISNYFFTEEEMIKQLKQSGIHLDTDSMYCLFIKINNILIFEESTEEEYYTLNYGIINVITEISNDCFDAYCVEGKTGEFYVIIAAQKYPDIKIETVSFPAPVYSANLEQLLAEGTTISFAQSYEQNFQQNVFETGNYGMFITSSSYAPLLLDKQKDGKLDFDWGVVSQPFWPEEKSGNNIKIIIPICIYRYTKYPEAAWKFVSFMSGEQGASLTAENLLFPAYDSETVQKTLISAAQRHQIKADLVDNARRSSLPACPTASEIDIFSFISNEYMDTLMGLITKDQCIRKIEDLHSRFPK